MQETVIGKAQRVARVISPDGSDSSFKVLRSGKRIQATPAAKKASRVIVDPPPTVDKRPLRVPVTQVTSSLLLTSKGKHTRRSNTLIDSGNGSFAGW